MRNNKSGIEYRRHQSKDKSEKGASQRQFQEN
jgi:hypothetical protein